MTLGKAIKQSIESLGTDVLISSLPNVVSDFSGYEEVPATKMILKEFISQGYGEKFLVIYSQKLPWEISAKSFLTSFLANSGFKEDICQYVFACVEYGLGWIKDEPEFVLIKDIKPQDYNEDLSGIDLEKQLVLMQKEYISMLNSLLVVPTGKLYKKSGFYSAQANAELWVIEHKINILGTALGKDLSSWCKTEKDKVLQQHERSKSSQLAAVFFKIALPVIVVMVLLVEGIFYINSLKAIQQYNASLAAGNELLSNGDYVAAITAFTSAANDYDGHFSSSKKKKKANLKVVEAVTPLYNNAITTARELNKSGKFYDARKTLSELQQYPITQTMKEQLKTEVENLEETITKAISDGKNTMLMCISAKGRKMDKSTMDLLNELLKVAPNDYWLTFIYNKTK